MSNIDDEYFSEISDEEVEVRDVIKIVFLGDSGVGKTNILSRFSRDEFSFDTKPTIGLDFAVKNIRMMDHYMRLQIWDTAGQERYQSFTSTYFKDSTGIILVYDISSQESFAHLDNWLNMVKANCNMEKIACILLANKIDLQDDRQVGEKEGREYAQRNGLLFAEVSAFSNTGNSINKAFNNLLKEIVPKYDFPDNDEPEIKSTYRNTIEIKPDDSAQSQEVKSKNCCLG